MVDEFTRESLAIEVDRSLPGLRVIRVLERLFAERGRPEEIRVDDGPEFVCRALNAWCEQRPVLLRFIDPGRPMQNGFVESFNGRFPISVRPGDSDRARGDKLLLVIHRMLEKSRGPFSFYQAPYRDEWLPSSPSAMNTEVKESAVPAPKALKPVPDSGELFIEPDEFDVLLRKLKREKNLILQRAPGVGKRFIARRLAEAFAGGPEQVRWVQFHETYSYEGFIRGYRPDEYVAHYHSERNHQGKGNVVLFPEPTGPCATAGRVSSRRMG